MIVSRKNFRLTFFALKGFKAQQIHETVTHFVDSWLYAYLITFVQCANNSSTFLHSLGFLGLDRFDH